MAWWIVFWCSGASVRRSRSFVAFGCHIRCCQKVVAKWLVLMDAIGGYMFVGRPVCLVRSSRLSVPVRLAWHALSVVTSSVCLAFRLLVVFLLLRLSCVSVAVNVVSVGHLCFHSSPLSLMLCLWCGLIVFRLFRFSSSLVLCSRVRRRVLSSVFAVRLTGRERRFWVGCLYPRVVSTWWGMGFLYPYPLSVAPSRDALSVLLSLSRPSVRCCLGILAHWCARVVHFIC